MTGVATLPLLGTEPPPLTRDRVVQTWVAVSTVSWLGDAVWVVALAWTAVHQLSATLAGVVIGLETLPQALLMLLGGVVADRFDTRRVLILGHLARMLLLCGAAAAWQAGLPALVVLLGVALALGTMGGLTMPANATLGRQLVAPDDLASLSGMTQVGSRGARLLGAPIGGVLVAAYGIVPAMLVEGATFGLVALALLVVIRPRFAMPRSTEHWRSSLAGGLGYLRHDPTARTLVVGLAGLNVFIGPVVAIGVTLRVSDSGWGALWVGYAEAAFACGAIVGSLLAIRVRPRHSAVAGFRVLVAQGVATIMVGVDARPAVLTGMLGLGLTAGLASVWLSGAYQRTIAPSHLGRVSSVSNLGDLTLLPLAIPLLGALAAHTSVLTATLVFGAAMSLLCTWFATRPALKGVV